ncbi:hypothetical protein CFC21_098240 [Triticum aestivum]|uniref:Uncharacterized protein n=3 Tax=Triticum TaxID=4564 RepID=A0A9R0ZED1_TRITD|nr:hypothetical protein CFC21_098240 [Triticum aestivum]VAI76359.1 unnamed protein product [Triticum turgidum subsp. durum]
MATTDWGPIIVAVVLFILLSPGFLFQLPARVRVVEFGNMGTSGFSILVHAILYFCLLTIAVVAIGVHVYASKPGAGAPRPQKLPIMGCCVGVGFL